MKTDRTNNNVDSYNKCYDGWFFARCSIHTPHAKVLNSHLKLHDWISPFLRYCKMYGNVFICTFGALSNLLLLLLRFGDLNFLSTVLSCSFSISGKGDWRDFDYPILLCKSVRIDFFPIHREYPACKSVSGWGLVEGENERWHKYGRESGEKLITI